ncbi:hypothetical protein Sipo8835_01155 [Streptomyces ipomoeae]|uniref:Uncharacterized protein n=1 Tax=Streptomyces ipomoeae TaxID=103232 RepID=A0AAE8W7C3_9ACTN|nr:hypothetical protein Sipo7851_41850 [Streptomyces ipomoeae]TQE39835.1 hypothetical protein Sipo8835_01155 [Streptomyces ipomoeae]
MLLAIEDTDAPTRRPFVHGVALISPELDPLPRGALNTDSRVPGVRLPRSGIGRGHLGPEPIESLRGRTEQV